MLPKKRGSGFTVMGGVSNCLNSKFYGEIVKSTNKDDFKAYLLNLKEHVNFRGRPYIILDNAAAHHSRLARPVLERYFRPLFLPPYSC